MKTKERWLAALKLQEVDRLGFWPKINDAYLASQSQTFRNMGLENLHRWIGSDMHIWLPGFIKEKRTTTYLEEKMQGNLRNLTYGTKYGNLVATMRFDLSSQSWHPVEFPVKEKNDINIMKEWFEDCIVDADADKLKEAELEYRRNGMDAVAVHSAGTTPMMTWVQHLAGIENAHYFLADYTFEVEELFELMYRKIRRITQILAEHSPADFIYLVENTSTTLISPHQYKKYCYNQISECATILKEAKKGLVLHMCGYLKDLLCVLATLPVCGFEAFTSPPVGNTTLYDGRKHCPDKCLIGGTNAVLWTKSAEEIINQIEKDLDILPHHRGIVISSAGVMPPFCRPETIKSVCEWVKGYKVKL